MPPKKRKTTRRRTRVVLVRGARAAPVRDPATGRWVSVPEDILWGTYVAAPNRWPALAGFARQVPVLGYYLDFGIKARKLGIEVDGLAFHGGQQAWAADHLRQRRIEAAGWRITRYTAREASEHPVAVLNEINRLWAR
jgi:very-short-patch-repair endonuclease